MIDDKILVQAFKKLDALEIGQTIGEKDVKNWELFKDCAKQYDLTYKNILFKTDYSELKKVKTFKEEIE